MSQRRGKGPTLPLKSDPTPEIEATQKEGAGDRASTQAEKIRKRLGWRVGILNGSGGKPKCMHGRTYQRLKSHHDALVQVSLQDMGRKLGILGKLRV